MPNSQYLINFYGPVNLVPDNLSFVQAESATDQMDWIEKITGVIASLLSCQSPEKVSFGNTSCINNFLIFTEVYSTDANTFIFSTFLPALRVVAITMPAARAVHSVVHLISIIPRSMN